MPGKRCTRFISGILIGCTLALYPAFCVQAQQTFWVFNHGVADEPAAFNYLRGSLGVSNTSQSIAPAARSNTTTLMDQATSLSSSVNASAAGRAKNVILVGHSQGGLRARRYLQRVLTRDASKPVSTAKVKGLALIGTPNYGAHAAINYPGFLNSVEAITAITLTYTVIGTPLLGTVRKQKDIIKKNIAHMYGGPSLVQMKPGSPFLNELNNYASSGCTTRTSSSNKTVLWVTKRVNTSSLSCGSGTHPGFKNIPTNTYVMNIVGQNSSLESAPGVWGVSQTPLEVATDATVLAAFFYAMAFPTGGFTLPVAIALTGLVILLVSLQLMWNGMIGSSRHDILISEESQELRNSRGIGGRAFIMRKLPKAIHAGPNLSSRNDKVELRNDQTRRALLELKSFAER